MVYGIYFLPKMSPSFTLMLSLNGSYENKKIHLSLSGNKISFKNFLQRGENALKQNSAHNFGGGDEEVP